MKLNQISSEISPEYHKLRTYISSRQRPRTAVSRSKNPEYRELYRYQDATRYNSANSLVAFYQDYPNRQGTPIKPPERKRPRSAFINQASRKSKLLKSMLQQHPTISNQCRRSIYSQGLQAPLKLGQTPLRIARYATGRSSYIVNDCHSRETNKAYARNDYGGGFFTR